MNQTINNLNMRDAMQAHLGFVQSQTSQIEAGLYRHKYPDLDYASLIPVDTSANPFIKSVTYYNIDGAGKAEWINGNAKDIPLVGIQMGSSETPVYMAGIGYDYGYEEVNQAAMLGISLPNEKAFYARRAYEEMVYNIALNGDTAKGFEGLFSYTGVPAASVANDGTGPSTLWSTKTGDLIARDINALIVGMFSATNTVEMANVVILPIERYLDIATKRMDANGSDMTVLEFIRRYNVYTAQTGQPLDIRGARGLLTKGSGNSARMIAYRKSPEVLKLHIPMPHRFLPLQVDVLRYLVPGVFRLGGLDIRLKKAVRYGDGI